MPEFTFAPAPVLVETTGEFAIGATGVLRPTDGGDPVPVTDLNDSPLPYVLVGPRGAHQAFKADIPHGILDFGSVLLPKLSNEAALAGFDAKQEAADARVAAQQAAAAAAGAATNPATVRAIVAETLVGEGIGVAYNEASGKITLSGGAGSSGDREIVFAYSNLTTPRPSGNTPKLWLATGTPINMRPDLGDVHLMVADTDATPVLVPTTLRIIRADIAVGQVTVQWSTTVGTDGANPTGVRVCHRIGSGAATCSTSDPVNGSRVITGLAPSTTYTITVQHLSGATPIGTPVTTTVTTPASPTNPGPTDGTFTQTVPAERLATTSWNEYEATKLVLGSDFGYAGTRSVIQLTNVQIPRGATVGTASLTVTPPSAESAFGGLGVRVAAHAADNAGFPGTAADIEALPLTTARSGQWTSTMEAWAGPKTSPPLTAVLQEIVNRPGWNAGQSILLVIYNDGSTAEGYFPAVAASLTASYTASGTTPPPVVNPPAPVLPVLAWGAPTDSFATADSLAASWPAGASGDRLFMVVSTRQGGTIVTPSGWSQVLRPTLGVGMVIAVFSRIAPATGSGTAIVNVTGGNSSAAVVTRAPASTRVRALSAGNDATLGMSFNATGGSVTAATEDVLLAIAAYSNDSTAVTATLSKSGSGAVGATATRVSANVFTGSDMHLSVHTATVTSGGTFTPSIGATYAGDQAGTGIAAFLVLSTTYTGTEPSAALVHDPGTAPEPPPVVVDPTPAPESGTRPFYTAADWHWAPIPASPQLDPNSGAMVSRLQTGSRSVALVDYGVSYVWPDEITAQTPRYTVTCTSGWGQPFQGMQIPIPNGTQPPPGSDGHIVIFDVPNNRIYSFWQANFSGSTKTASYGAVTMINGDGREISGSSTGASVGRAAGIITDAEMAAGEIKHALTFATDWAAPSNDFRYPATKSDGNGSGQSGEIPEGARMQLDPTVNVEALNIPEWLKIIARCLQRYGAYCIDNGGARLAFGGEWVSGNSPSPGWQARGVTSDYPNLAGLPWDRMRFLHTNVTQP